MHPISSLFLSQSYEDAWADYSRSLVRPQFVHWDYVVLTASNEQQAEGFRVQLEERRRAKFLPEKTKFAVIPDPGGKRVGSGGATLGILRYIANQAGSSDFSGLRILVIHSGGDSKRVPQYSALGKLFSPVPHELPNGRASTLFDELMIAMENRERLYEIWGQLPEEDLILLEGKYILRCSDSELAEQLHCKPNSIRMKLTRVRRKVFGMMNSGGGDGK